MTTSTSGTGTITLGTAVTNYLTFALAGVTTGQTVSYAILDTGAAASETGTGVYTTAGLTLTRNVTTSTNGNAAISLSGNAEVYITARAQDIGSWIWISTGTASTSATLDFTALDTTTYKSFALVFRNIVPASNAVNLFIRVGTGAGPTYQATTYINLATETTAIALYDSFNAANAIILNTANLGVSGVAVISNLDSGTALKLASGSLTGTVSGRPVGCIFAGYWNTATAVTALRVLFSSGNISTGSIDLYGIKANM